jgi:NarL family two-component system response regulator YdfI
MRILIANDHPLLNDGLRHTLAGLPTIELVGQASSLAETIRMVGELEPHVLVIDPQMQHGTHDGLHVIKMIRGEWPQTAIVILTAQHDNEHMLRALRIGVASYLTTHAERSTLLRALHAAARGETLLAAEAMHHLLAQLESTHHHNQPHVQEATITTTSNEPVQTTNDSELQTAKHSELHTMMTRQTTSIRMSKQAAMLEKQPLTERECEVLQRVARGERNKEIASTLGISSPTVKTHLANIYFKLGVDSRAAAIAIALEKGMISLLHC